MDQKSTWRNFRQVQKEGGKDVTRKVSIYILDVIISVGYRVKSQVGTEFRNWATHHRHAGQTQGLYTIPPTEPAFVFELESIMKILN